METILLSSDERQLVAEKILEMLDRADHHNASARHAGSDWERGFHDGLSLATQVAAFQFGELTGLVEKGVFKHVGEEIAEYRERVRGLAGRPAEVVR